MVVRALILEGGLRIVAFKTDIMKVWGLISVITRDLDSWTYVKSAQSTRYGRKSYRDLWDHFLGLDNFDDMARESKIILVATHYSGKRKRFNFERYVKIQKVQQHILEDLKETWACGD